jgi:hypothetical protein
MTTANLAERRFSNAATLPGRSRNAFQHLKNNTATKNIILTTGYPFFDNHCTVVSPKPKLLLMAIGIPHSTVTT